MMDLIGNYFFTSNRDLFIRTALTPQRNVDDYSISVIDFASKTDDLEMGITRQMIQFIVMAKV